MATTKLAAAIRCQCVGSGLLMSNAISTGVSCVCLSTYPAEHLSEVGQLQQSEATVDVAEFAGRSLVVHLAVSVILQTERIPTLLRDLPRRW